MPPALTPIERIRDVFAATLGAIVSLGPRKGPKPKQAPESSTSKRLTPEAVHQFTECAKRACNLLAEINSVPEGPSRLKKQMRMAKKGYLDRYEVKVCAILRALARRGAFLPSDVIMQRAAKMSLWAPLKERVVVTWKATDKGGYPR